MILQLKSLSRCFLQIRSWLKQLFLRAYNTQIIEGELPGKLKIKTVYVVQEDGYLEHVSILCPCGCKEILHMNLIPDERPCWQVTDHPDRTVSISPSIWRKQGCKSHFWLQHGRVYWVH